MSKAINIQKNGVDTPITVDKLRTNAAGGGTIDWVSEDETRCDMLNVTANGTYSAASAGKYGYDVVSVSVPGTEVTGTGPDGNTYVVTKDGSGNLVETKVPSEIRVTKLPNTLTYEVGSALSFDGIEVTAYYGDGSVYGVIPSADLIFPVTQAPMEPAKAIGHATLDGSSIDFVCESVTETFNLGGGYNRVNTITVVGSVYLVNLKSKTNDSHLPAIYTKDQNAVVIVSKTLYLNNRIISDDEKQYTWSALDHKTSAGGVEYGWHYASISGGGVLEFSDDVIPYSAIESETEAGEILFGGQITYEGGYQVPVQWNRPGDGATLETSYGISVTEITGGGGQAGDNGTGRND